MINVHRAVEAATSLLHVIGGLSSAVMHILAGDMGGAIVVTLVASACMLILAGAVALAEVAQVKVRQYVLKHDERVRLPEPRDKEGNDA